MTVPLIRWQRPMVAVLIACVPCVASAVYRFGWRSGAVILAVSAAAFAAEWALARRRRQPANSAALVTGLLLALTLPPTVPFWLAALGGIAAIALGKEAFGGFGRNMFNPALVGRAVIYFIFPAALTQHWAWPAASDLGGLACWATDPVDPRAIGTAEEAFRLQGVTSSWPDLLTGNHIGAMGETAALAVLIGAVYLIARRITSWQIIVAVLIGATGLSAAMTLAGVRGAVDPVHSVLAGGLLFGAVFMATDPVSASKTPAGRWIYGLLIGGLTVAIRALGVFPEGVMFAVLIMNAFAPAIDRIVRPSSSAPQPAAPGRITITVNSVRRLKVHGGLSLLYTLMTQKIFVPSACGGRGTCAYCKVKVKSGGGPVLPVEEPYLTAAERAQGMRLSCQVMVNRDLDIELPEELFAIQPYRARVERITDLTYDTKELRFRLIEPERIEFKAGQYIQLETPRYEGNRQEVYRAYSMSSAPRDQGAIETIIRLVPNGICTTWVFRYLKVGDEVRFNGPYGDFFLRPTVAEVIFVAGGTGFAPVKSILQDQPEEIARRGGRFFFGARTGKDLFHLELMRDLTAKHPNIRFIPALSQPDPDDVWDGERGLITEVLGRHITHGSNKEFYLCGSPAMIDACLILLRKKGVQDNAIFFDKFA